MAEDFWKTRLKSEGIDFPEYLSFSAYQQMTQCPKQWLLSNAFYPEIWTNRGYPERLNERTIMGIATHQALETVIKKIKEDLMHYINVLIYALITMLCLWMMTTIYLIMLLIF